MCQLDNLHTFLALPPNPCNTTFKIKKAQNMATPIFTLSPEMQESWDYVMGQMLSFVNDTNADVDMAYDFVCEQLGIDSFVANNDAWDDFYTYWEAADNRNQTEYNFA
ncbi:hypothetical protein SBM1_00201 [Synechococcus phage S-BM1]|nr:hypothetical protein SBM1_00201 [Synechococcus phage S-BM1]